MTDIIDELFSPERLRRNWQRSAKTVRQEGATEEVFSAPRQILRQIRILIEQQFNGDDLVVLNLMLEELQGLFGLRGEATTAEEVAELDAAIHEIINKVEDLLEAFEIGGRGR